MTMSLFTGKTRDCLAGFIVLIITGTVIVSGSSNAVDFGQWKAYRLAGEREKRRN